MFDGVHALYFIIFVPYRNEQKLKLAAIPYILLYTRFKELQDCHVLMMICKKLVCNYETRQLKGLIKIISLSINVSYKIGKCYYNKCFSHFKFKFLPIIAYPFEALKCRMGKFYCLIFWINYILEIT